MANELKEDLSLVSSYTAKLSDDGTKLWVTGVVDSVTLENTVKESLAQGHEVHIFLGRTPSPSTITPTNPVVTSVHRLGQLLQQLDASTQFACEATCIGIHH